MRCGASGKLLVAPQREHRSKIDEVDYWVPEHVRECLRGMGFQLPLEPMESHIRAWHEWMQACGSFYDYRDSDGFGRVYEVHRRSIHPAMRVCRERGSLLLNDKTQVVCDDQACTDWLQGYFERTGFFPSAQATVVRAFGMGTGAWALWIDAGRKDVRIRRYDARMVIPLSWDEERVTECAFVTWALYRGQAVDQLQMHLLGSGDGAEPSTSSPSHANGKAPSKWKVGYGCALAIPSEPSPSKNKASGAGASPSKSKAGASLQDFAADGCAQASPADVSPRTRSSRCCSTKTGTRYSRKGFARNTIPAALSPPSRS